MVNRCLLSDGGRMIGSGFSLGRYEGIRMRSLEHCRATSNLEIIQMTDSQVLMIITTPSDECTLN